MTESRPRDYAITIVRSAFAALPYFGGLFNELFFDHRARTKARRFEEFVSGLARDVERLGESAINRSYLESEEFGDLTEATLRRVVISGSKIKRERLRRVLVSQMYSPLATDYQELFLDLVSEVGEKEIEILSAYREAKNRPQGEEEGENSPKREIFRSPEYYDLDTGEYRFLIQHLIARSLMYDDGIGRWNTAALKILEISELGCRFLEFIEGETSLQP